MYRIDNSTAVTNLPTFPNPGTPGYFTNGNPNLAAAATIVDDWWLNQVQEEILAVIAFAGYTPDKNNRHQLLDSLNRLYTGTGTVGAYLPLIGGTLRRSGGGSNILTIQTEAGLDNNIIMQIDGQHQWGVGPGSGGYFRIYNYTTGQNCFRINQATAIAEFPATDIMLSRQPQALHYILREGGTGIAFARPGGANMPELIFAADNGRFQGTFHSYRLRGYWPGGTDPLYLFADAGQNCLAHFQVAGGHEYGVGAGLDGSFYLLYDWTDNDHVLRYANGVLYSGRDFWSPIFSSTNFRVSDGGSMWALNAYISQAIVQGAAPGHANAISAMRTLSSELWAGVIYSYPGNNWLSINSGTWINAELHVQGYTGISGNMDVGGNISTNYVQANEFYSTGNVSFHYLTARAGATMSGGLVVWNGIACQNQLEVAGNTNVNSLGFSVATGNAINLHNSGLFIYSGRLWMENCLDITVNGNHQLVGPWTVTGHLTANGGSCMWANLWVNSSFEAQAGGNVYITHGLYGPGGAITCDERLKRNIVDHPIKDALAGLRAVKFYEYDQWDEDNQVTTEHAPCGFVAQQMQTAIPEVVAEHDYPVRHDCVIGGRCDPIMEPRLAIDTLALTAHMIRAIQQLADKVEQLERR